MGLADYNFSEENDLERYWEEFEKKESEEGRFVVGVIIPSTKVNINFSMKTNFMIIPENLPR